MRTNSILIYSFIVMILIFQTPRTTDLLVDIGSYFPYEIANTGIKTGDIIGNTSAFDPAFASSNSASLSSGSAENDIFGVKKIYPTKNGGREWFINMDDPRGDG